jgi:hypothetical protein
MYLWVRFDYNRHVMTSTGPRLGWHEAAQALVRQEAERRAQLEKARAANAVPGFDSYFHRNA